MSSKKDNLASDKYFMRMALSLAKDNAGLTKENPSVGCVLVKDNRIISTGATSLNGRPHAEYNALKNCQISTRGSTAYVTLEPCTHIGKTNPCSNLLIKSKVKKVIYSISDIDKRTSNKAERIFKNNGIKVKKRCA